MDLLWLVIQPWCHQVSVVLETRGHFLCVAKCIRFIYLFIDLIADFVTLRIKVGSHKSSVCRVFARTRCFW